MADTLESLEVKVKHGASGADVEINNLVTAITRLKGALTGLPNEPIKNLADTFKAAAGALKGANTSQLTKFAEAMANVAASAEMLGDNSEAIGKLAEAMTAVSGVKVYAGAFNSLATGVKNVGEASKTLTWGTYVAADSQFPSPAWTFMTMDGVSGDITKWNQLHLNVSDFDNALEYKLRVVFKENDGSNPPSGPTVEVDATPDGKGNIDIDLAKLDWSKCDRTKIQDVTIYGLDRIDATKNASVKVNEAWLTTKPAEAKPDGPASIDPAIDDADPAVVANKAALLTAITKGKNADLTNKTSASKKALADAIAEGEAQLASKNTTIAKIDAARRAILQAIDELENRPAPIAAIAVPEGWRSVITNGTLEGDDMSCFFSKTSGGAPEPSVAVDYEGVDDWKAIVINSTASTASQDWDDQFFIKATEKLAVGTKYRVEFDYRSDIEGAADTQTHNQPSEYIHWACINSVTFKPEWQHHKFEGTVSNDQTGNFQTVAFNMSKNRKDTKFVIDNIVFLVEDTTTGIKSVENNTGDVQYFDLQGRRVAQPAKGLYIKNGKMVMVK